MKTDEEYAALQAAFGQVVEEQGKKAAAIEAIASEMLEAWYDGADGDDVLGTYAKRLWEALSANPKL